MRTAPAGHRHVTGPPTKDCTLLRWLDYLPFLPLLVGAVALGLAPFDEPHLWHGFKALALGQTLRYVDVLDLIMHLSLPALLGLKVLRHQLCVPASN